MDRFSKCVSERCYGVEVADGKTLLVAEVVNGRPEVTGRYATDESGIQALTRHVVANGTAHPRICIRACGALALGVALALMAVPGGEVLMLANQAMPLSPHPGGALPPTPEARAERLASLAKRML